VVFVIAHAFTRDSQDPQIDTKCLWFTLVFIPLLFVVNRFMPRKEKEVYYHEEPDTSLAGSYLSRQKVKISILLWLLFTGPRLVDWVIYSFRRISHLKRQDTHSCAAVLWLLLVKGKRVQFTDIQIELDWVDVEKTMAELAWMDGLLFIKTGPPAASLSDDFRTEIRRDLIG